MAEFSKDNRFPFYQSDKTVSISYDHQEDLFELDLIYGKIVERFPALRAEDFYSRLDEINRMTSGNKVAAMKDACDRLLKNIRSCLGDERFIHGIYDRWGFGV